MSSATKIASAIAGATGLTTAVCVIGVFYLFNDVSIYYNQAIDDLLNIKDLANVAWYEMRPQGDKRAAVFRSRRQAPDFQYPPHCACAAFPTA
ncbi:unnamed protein product, partial [Cylicostephanus goldi]